MQKKSELKGMRPEISKNHWILSWPPAPESFGKAGLGQRRERPPFLPKLYCSSCPKSRLKKGKKRKTIKVTAPVSQGHLSLDICTDEHSTFLEGSTSGGAIKQLGVLHYCTAAQNPTTVLGIKAVSVALAIISTTAPIPSTHFTSHCTLTGSAPQWSSQDPPESSLRPAWC